MTEEGRGSLWAFRKSWSSKPLFGGGDSRRWVEAGIVEAESLEAARKRITSRSSVLSLEYGVTLEILPISFSSARVFFAQYDAPPMDGSHRPTGAKLVVGPLL